MKEGDDGYEEAKGIRQVIKEAMPKFALEEDTILFRGADNFRKLFEGKLPKVGDKRKWKGFVSTTINRYIADGYSQWTSDGVVVELTVPKGTNGIPLGMGKLSTVHTQDKEFLMNERTQYEVLSVEKKHNGYYVKARILK
ncbi:hypothetical protein FACS189419_05150 [Planctomycetales bacterium]|nr:hypothetical protein FACS189419_05150 [Planctomycetales bacterium]